MVTIADFSGKTGGEGEVQIYARKEEVRTESSQWRRLLSVNCPEVGREKRKKKEQLGTRSNI